MATRRGSSRSAIVNPLANPKGQTFECEICGKTARFQCKNCRVTYYCTKEHQEADWESIHEKICRRLIPLRQSVQELGSMAERNQRELELLQTKRVLLDLTRNDALKFLHQSHFERAIPAALQALRFSIAVYGAESIDLVPAHLLLGEAYLGLGRSRQAEEYLSLAKWSVLRSQQCSDSVRAQMHRNFGRLYASQGKFGESLRHLGDEVYYSSLVHGPEHVNATGGFYNMGTVLLEMTHRSKEAYEEGEATEYVDKTEQALAMYSKVVAIWYQYLVDALTNPEFAGPDLTEVQITEALAMLRGIRVSRGVCLGQSHASVGESEHVLAMLHIYLDEVDAGRDALERAIKIFREEYDADHPSTREATGLLETLAESSSGQ